MDSSFSRSHYGDALDQNVSVSIAIDHEVLPGESIEVAHRWQLVSLKRRTSDVRVEWWAGSCCAYGFLKIWCSTKWSKLLARNLGSVKILVLSKLMQAPREIVEPPYNSYLP